MSLLVSSSYCSLLPLVVLHVDVKRATSSKVGSGELSSSIISEVSTFSSDAVLNPLLRPEGKSDVTKVNQL